VIRRGTERIFVFVFQHARLAAVSACLLLGAINSSAAEIVVFGASASASTQFTVSGLTTIFNGETAASATFTCNATTICSGLALSFLIVINPDVSTATNLSVQMAGTASAAASDSFAWSTANPFIVTLTAPFNVERGPFDKTIFSTTLPGPILVPPGTSPDNFGSADQLDLTLQPGESITSTVSFAISDVPEPSSLALLLIGLFGVAEKLRRESL
jgi:PEP-CTERM motif